MTRDQILNAAAQIFSQKGYHGTSMQDIALAVKLQKGSLYYHVSSKQEILLDLLNRALDILIERVNLAIMEADNPQDRLRNAMSTYIKSLIEYQDLAVVLLLEHRSLEPELQSRHLPKRDQFEDIWRDLIIQGKEKGSFSCEHPSLSARALLGAMNWIVTWYRKEGLLSAEGISEQYADLFLDGLASENHQ